jgi:preprotein translocase subunit SecG
MYTIILILHVVVAMLLMAVVLMQSGRGGAMGSSFGGGGGSQTLFGGRGATSFLTKATWILGSGFMLTSLVLALTIGQRQGINRSRSLLRENPISAPAVPGSSEIPGSSGQTPAAPAPIPETPSGAGGGQ